MFIPDDNQNTGGSTQPNTENAPSEPMNLSDAGRAFFDSLMTDASATPAEETVEDDPNLVDIPADDSGVTPSNDTPAANDTTLESIRDSILAEIRGLNQNAEPEGDPNAEEPADEGFNMNDDEFMEKFSENPLQAVMELSNMIADQKVREEMQALGEKMQPLLDQAEEAAFQNAVRETIAEFLEDENFSDAEQYLSQIAEHVKANGLPMDDVASYQNAYKDIALADARANRGKSLDDYMADDNEIAKIISNPKIQEQVIKAYLQGINQGGKPAVISSGGSTTPTATPPTEFKTFADAGAAFRRQL